VKPVIKFRLKNMKITCFTVCNILKTINYKCSSNVIKTIWNSFATFHSSIPVMRENFNNFEQNIFTTRRTIFRFDFFTKCYNSKAKNSESKTQLAKHDDKRLRFNPVPLVYRLRVLTHSRAVIHFFIRIRLVLSAAVMVVVD